MAFPATQIKRRKLASSRYLCYACGGKIVSRESEMVYKVNSFANMQLTLERIANKDDDLAYHQLEIIKDIRLIDWDKKYFIAEVSEIPFELGKYRCLFLCARVEEFQKIKCIAATEGDPFPFPYNETNPSEEYPLVNTGYINFFYTTITEVEPKVLRVDFIKHALFDMSWD